MDLDPFEPVGITAQTMRLLDVFLLHCLLTDSPPDTPEEIAVLKRNQHLTAERGREAGLLLQRGSEQVPLREWGAQVLAECEPIAAALDAAHGGSDYGQALAAAQATMAAPQATPSAHVLAEIVQQHESDFTAFACARSRTARDVLLAQPWTEAQQQRYTQLAEQSLAQQQAIEAADTLPFEAWREQYMAVDQLG